MLRMGLIGAAAFALAGPAAAQPSDALVAKAKAEKEVVYYTELIVEQIVRPLAAAFERKYGIKVTYWRGDSQAAALRLAMEHKAARVQADVWSTASGIGALLDSGLIERFSIPNAAALPERFRDPAGYWVATNLIVIGAALNTGLIAARDRPRSVEDLLAPRWRNQMVWKPNDVTGAWGFIGNVLTNGGEARGLAYLRQLNAQSIAPVAASTRAILDGVIGGEHALVLGVSAHNTQISVKAGAPVAWLSLGSAWATPHTIGVTSGAPHPNAARLLIDFVVSGEGQEIFRQAGYLPARADTPPLSPAISPELAGFPVNVIAPEQLERNLAHWSDVYDEIFR
ncbi:MAG TPA: extracellular solute-binding protein [Xanthobacteraceae bacterium]